MRSHSANQRELSQAEYNAYKCSSKINFENSGLSKSPIIGFKQKDKVGAKLKSENKKYTEIIKSKENYSKGNNININININNINNINNNFANAYGNSINSTGNLFSNRISQYANNNNSTSSLYLNNNLHNSNINKDFAANNKSPENFIQASSYSNKLKSASSLKGVSLSSSSAKNQQNSLANSNSNSGFSYNNFQNYSKANSNKLIVESNNCTNNNTNLHNNNIISNSTNYSNSNFASKNLQNNNSTNNFLNPNQSSMLNNSTGKKYNQDEIRYKLKKIFEYYCQFGDRLNTTCLKSNKFIKFSSEAEILDENINKTRLELIFSSENKTKSKSQIDFECFLNCLVKVAEFKYGNEYKGPNKCLQALIDVKILPLYEKIFNSNSNGINNLHESESDILMQSRNQVSNFCSDTLRGSFSNFNLSNTIPAKAAMRRGSDFIFDSKTSFDLMDQNIFTSSFAFCSSVKNLNSKSKNFFNKIDDIQEVVNSHNNSVLGSEGNILNNNNNNFLNEDAKTEIYKDNEKNKSDTNYEPSPNLNWDIKNINPNLPTRNFIDVNNNNNNFMNNEQADSNANALICGSSSPNLKKFFNTNNNNINNNFQENISSIIFQNPTKKNLHFEENFQKSQLEEILANAASMLFEIYRVYFPWELSLTNDENFMRENSQKNYFLLLKEFDICPDIISKSAAFQIWKEQVEDKLEKISFDNNKNNNSAKSNSNKAINSHNYLDRINENIIYYNVIKNIDTSAFSSNIARKNPSSSGSKEKKHLGKYFSFVKFLKCLCLIAENGIEKYCNFENEMENLENLNIGDLGLGLSAQQKTFKQSLSVSNNLNTSCANNLTNNSDLGNLNWKLNDINNVRNSSCSKNLQRSMSLNSNVNVKSSIYKYEYNLAEKVFLLLEKMEFSKGFLNIQHKTSKTNSYKSSFIVSKDISDKIKTDIENKINEIKKENNNDLEKREDYENLQRQKKLRLSIKNNFKNIFEHGNYIVDRYGAKLSDLFKNYCCFGDPLNTTWMKSNKFSKLLKDANLLILNSNNANNNNNNLNNHDNTSYSEVSGAANCSNGNNITVNHSNNRNRSNPKNNNLINNNNIKAKEKEKEQRGILVNDIDVIFIKLSSANSLNIGNNNINTSIYGSNLRDLSMNTYISLGTFPNRNSLNMTRSSFSSSLSPNKIQTLKKSVYSITNSAKIDFNGFVNAIEIISLNIFPEKNEFEAIDIIVNKHLLPLLKNFNHKNKYSDKYSILFQEKSNNFEYNDLISAFSKAITPIYKYYVNVSTNALDFDTFIRFCSDFGIFPDLISKSKLSNIFKATSSNDFSYSEASENNTIDLNLFVDACCLISLENPTKESTNISNIDKFVSLIEKISISGGISKISKDLKYIRISNIGESYSIIDTVKNFAKHLFPKKEQFKKMSFFEILQNE